MDIAPPFSLTYVTTSVTVLASLSVLLLGLVISPLISPHLFHHYIDLPTDKKDYWNSLLASTVHAVVVCSLIGVAIVIGSVDTTDYLVYSKSLLGFTTMQLSLGYFVGDFMLCLLKESLRKELTFIIHHTTSIFAVFLGLAYEGRWMILIMVRLFTELSTPFFNLMWALTSMNIPKSSPCFVFAGVNMMVTFVLTRVLAIPFMWYVLYVIMQQEENELTTVPLSIQSVVVIMTACLDVLNIVWSCKIVSQFIESLKELKGKKK